MALPSLSGGATFTMPAADYYELDRLFANLRAELEQARSANIRPETETTTDLRAALDAALVIVQFAVGTLNPESTRGWPHESLQALAERLLAMADGDAALTTLGITLRGFAGECRDFEAFRANRTQAALAITQTVEPPSPPSPADPA